MCENNDHNCESAEWINNMTELLLGHSILDIMMIEIMSNTKSKNFIEAPSLATSFLKQV